MPYRPKLLEPMVTSAVMFRSKLPLERTQPLAWTLAKPKKRTLALTATNHSPLFRAGSDRWPTMAPPPTWR